MSTNEPNVKNIKLILREDHKKEFKEGHLAPNDLAVVLQVGTTIYSYPIANILELSYEAI